MKQYPLKNDGWFAIKNAVFDVIMPRLSGSAFKVLCVAIRKTYGWQDAHSPKGRKVEDWIPYSQFLELTGIGSRSTISRAIEECLTEGVLLRREDGKVQGGSPRYLYRLNPNYSPPNQDDEPEPETAQTFDTETVPKTDDREIIGTETVPLIGTEIVPKTEIIGTVSVLSKEQVNTTNKSVVVVENSTNEEPNEETKLLRGAGIFENELTKALFENPPPLETIRGWLEYAKSLSGVNNALGVIIPHLLQHDPPPQQKKPKRRTHGAIDFREWQRQQAAMGLGGAA